MNFLNSLKTSLKSTNIHNFEEKAVELFKHQSKYNQIYQKYIHNLKIDAEKVKSIHQIPFLPISFFKRHTIKTESWKEEKIFESSGTTDHTTSKHFVRSMQHYLNNAQLLFEQEYGAIKDYHILALLPSYLERNNSSLVYMVDHFIKLSNSSISGFYLDNLEELELALNKAYTSGRKVLLIGVSFGLLDLVETYQFDMQELTVVETGGMKGRRKEMIREELHAILKNGFGVSTIHSEYGMTELLSQSYSKGQGVFQPSTTMRILIRDINDPFSYLPIGKNGGINVVDLANADSCAFIETQDLGKLNTDGTFEVLGRFDNSDVRGCNLLIS